METGLSYRLTHQTYCDRVSDEISRTADVVRLLDPDTALPTCPTWTANRLALHIGMIHRWVDRTVAEQATEPLEFTQFGAGAPADWLDIGDWLADTSVTLPATLRAADPSDPAWSFTDDQTASFWARRLLHETAVHRMDLEIAAGEQPSFDRDSAVDGIDELLYLLSYVHPFREELADLRGDGETIHLHADDSGAHWLIRLTPAGHTWERMSTEPDATASVTVRGAAADLHRFQYNRVGNGCAVEWVGSAGVLDDWLRLSAL